MTTNPPRHPCDADGKHASCGYLTGLLKRLMCRRGHLLPGPRPT